MNGSGWAGSNNVPNLSLVLVYCQGYLSRKCMLSAPTGGVKSVLALQKAPVIAPMRWVVMRPGVEWYATRVLVRLNPNAQANGAADRANTSPPMGQIFPHSLLPG